MTAHILAQIDVFLVCYLVRSLFCHKILQNRKIKSEKWDSSSSINYIVVPGKWIHNDLKKTLFFIYFDFFSLSLSNCLLYFAVIHVAAHYFNFERLLESHSADNIKGILSRWPTSPNGSWVNPIRTANTVNFYANFSKLQWLIFKGQITEKW